MCGQEPAAEIPAEVLSSPALLFLYYRIEQILGIKATGDAVKKLNESLEKNSGTSFIENPAAFERMLSSREEIFRISEKVTVNETYFFREGAHFDSLVSYLPQLAKLKRPIQVCSAATSIGCEAYSLAMLLDYYAKNGPSFDFEIDAFDISAGAIETAKNARYTANALRTDGAAWKHIIDTYLLPDRNEYIVSHVIRKKINFFPHNILRGFKKQYDVIFFRNALIYFSSRNRLIVVNDLADSLYNDGLLFLGVSETSSIKHPLLASRYLSNAFFFQKIFLQKAGETVSPISDFPFHAEKRDGSKFRGDRGGILSDSAKHIHTVSAHLKPPAVSSLVTIDCEAVAAILETGEKQQAAKKTLGIILDGRHAQNDGDAASLKGHELAASVFYFLEVRDFNSADLILSYLEKHNAGACAMFLRGEYHLMQGSVKVAENFFEHAARKDRAFWPAFYRIASLAAEGNAIRFEYRIKKACESMELGKGLHYECFLGGFSPDYFQRLLNQRLVSRQTLNDSPANL